VRTGKFKTMHIITAAVVLVLGTATLLLHDKRFIQWKPTVLLGLTSIAFLGSLGVGKQPLVRRMLEALFDEPLKISTRTWLLINLVWVVWFALLAVANIYVARHFAESVWVNFKVFGISVATMIFLIPQVLWLSGKTTQVPPAPAPAPETSRTQRLRERLESRFAPAQLDVEDESHLHEGHAGAAGGQSHFRIRIVSESFRGIPSVARHRLVYAAVDDLLKTDIHALAIEALAPE
jgi:intracellular septation protein